MIINKRGQIEVTFNWVYILIAGAVILLFFTGIIFKAKQSAEANLNQDLINTIESIFTAAQKAEKTKNFIDTSGLVDYVLYFNCENGIGTYGIKGQGASVEDSVAPIFAPLEISTSRLITWSLPYKLPFKVIDFLIVTSVNTKYYLIGEDEFAEEFYNATLDSSESSNSLNRFNVERITDFGTIAPEGNFQLRIIDSEGRYIHDDDDLPGQLKLRYFTDDKVSAVAFSGNTVNYYQKEGDKWKKLNLNPILIVSLGGEKDAAKYAAVFSGNDQMYECNMQKAFKRLRYLNEVYGGEDIQSGNPGRKLQEMITYYFVDNPTLQISRECLTFINGGLDNLQSALMSHQNNVQACLVDYARCVNLIDSAQKVRNANQNLAERGNCIPLY